MSDLEWRALERRYRESGAPEDGAAFLRARRRAGELDDHRLELLSFLGHGPARLLLGHELLPLPLLPPESPEPWDAWAEEADSPPTEGGPLAITRLTTDLSPWGREACVRAGRAAVALACARLGAVSALEREGLAAVDRWVAAAWEERKAQQGAVRRLWRSLEKTCPGSAYARLPAILSDEFTGSSLAAAVAGLLEATHARGPEHAVHTAVAASAHLLRAEHRQPAAASPRTRAAILAELSPWILTEAPHLFDQRSLDRALAEQIQASHWFGDGVGGSGHMASVSPSFPEVLWVALEGEQQRVIFRYSIVRESEFGGDETIYDVSLLRAPDGAISERRELNVEVRSLLEPYDDD